MVLIEPEDSAVATITTSHILSIIDKHASTTALVLLPGVQYYTGQYLDIKTITAHAHRKGILIGWDLAHAVGNVDLQLTEWDVDFAVWCNYKYVNSGPGAVGGLYVNDRHGQVDVSAMGIGEEGFRNRLCGWWGGDKAVRFAMGNRRLPFSFYAVTTFRKTTDVLVSKTLFQFLVPLDGRLAIPRLLLSQPSLLHWRYSHSPT